MKQILPVIMFLLPVSAFAQLQMVSNRTVHLRHGTEREWTSFPVNAGDSQLVLQFDLKRVDLPVTIGVTQEDVNHRWNVILNDSVIGDLVEDENRMVTYYECAPSIIKKKNNTLKILPKGNYPQSDDINVGNISLHYTTIKQLLSESSLNIQTTSRGKHLPGQREVKGSRDDQQLIPSRLTIINEQNALQPVTASPGDTLTTRSGVIYSGTGNYSFTLPAGTYRVYASRGFEYGVDSAVVIIKPKQRISRKFNLPHEVNLPGWASCDPHVHTREYSGHGDATMRERVITLAGEGLEYAVITEHNRTVDISETVEKMGMSKWLKPIKGYEMTTKVGHFNIFPIEGDSVPSWQVNNWQEVARNLGSEERVIILNHARDVHNDFRPADILFTLSERDIPANAMEVMNSGSQQTDPRQLYMDWLRLISKGIFLAPVGSSDSHDVSRFIVGQSRSYVPKDSSLTESFLKRRVAVSFGLFTELQIEPGRAGNLNITAKAQRNKKIPVTIKIHFPSWVKPRNVALYANGRKIFSEAVSVQAGKNVVVRRIFVPASAPKTIFVAIAEGPNPRVPWWPIAKPYQHTSPVVDPIILGISAPVVIP